MFAFLDTPLSVCLARIAARRLAKGNDKPVDPKNTAVKHANIVKGIPKITGEFGRRGIIIDHRKAVPQVLGLYRNAEV